MGFGTNNKLMLKSPVRCCSELRHIQTIIPTMFTETFPMRRSKLYSNLRAFYFELYNKAYTTSTVNMFINK